VGGDVSIDSDALLVIAFVDLKIKLIQSFECAHESRMCVRVFIGVNDHMYISIYIYTVFLKKLTLLIIKLLSGIFLHLNEIIVMPAPSFAKTKF
jgi:hypothetical protein